MTPELSARGKKNAAPAPGLVAQVRGRLILSGSTLADWARLHNLHKGTVHHALTGRRRGPRSRQIAEVLKKEVGL
jgi:gp16 family phage-associated protein